MRHLIVCPLSVMENWNGELGRSVGLCWRLYRGEKEERSTLRDELLKEKHAWNVIVTSYEVRLHVASQCVEKALLCADVSA